MAARPSRPWNLRDEIIAQLAYIRERGGQFVTSVPCLAVDYSDPGRIGIYASPLDARRPNS